MRESPQRIIDSKKNAIIEGKVALTAAAHHMVDL